MITAKSIPAFNAARLWKRIDKSGGEDACWPWTGSRAKSGHGQINIGGSVFKCHRVTLHLTSSPPSQTHYACHTCDNGWCCNPKHLYWGTAISNVADRESRGRRKGPSGTTHHKAKLDPDKVREIRKLASIMKQRDLAAQFGVAQGVIWNIIHKKFWKDVDDGLDSGAGLP